jgi:hypothetical protein
LGENYQDGGTTAVNDWNFSQSFIHSSLGISSYHFDYDGRRYTHEILVSEFVDRLADALASEKSSVEMTQVQLNDEGSDIERLSEVYFLAAESARDKPLPMGIVEVSFTTTAAAPFDAYVLLIAKYASVF